MLFWLALTGMLIWRFVVYEPPGPVMSKAVSYTHLTLPTTPYV